MRKLVLLGLFFMIAATSVFVGCSKKDDSSSSSTSLSVDKSSITATKDGGTSVITVTAGTAWTAVSSQTWATVTPASGSGNGSIVVIATANTSTSSRTATITIISGSDTKVVVVTQDGTSGGGGSSLSVDKTTITATKDAVTSTVAVTATSAWTASSNQTWAKITGGSGSANGTFTVATEANTTTATRTATITVTAGSQTVTITVNQDAASANTVTDASGNNYKTVLIGTQTWFAENLQTEKYSDGSAITYLSDNTQWKNATTGAYCSFNNDATIRATYGRLYNWFAVNTGKLCPTGWHVPSDTEWNTLEIYLQNNGYNYDGTVDTDNDNSTKNKIAKAMVSSTITWVNNSTNLIAGTGAIGNTGYSTYINKSGFSALPGGSRDIYGGFNSLLTEASFWSTTTNTYDGTYADNRKLSYFHASLLDMSERKGSGLSVRCLKN